MAIMYKSQTFVYRVDQSLPTFRLDHQTFGCLAETSILKIVHS